jgi:hypothetical protein
MRKLLRLVAGVLCGELRRIAAEVAQRLIGCRAKFSAGLSA